MTDILRIKRRVTGSPGAPSSLANAELAYNEVDHILYYGEGTGGTGGSATVVVGIGGQGLASALAPTMNGTATAGSASTWSRGDHVHPVDTSRAPLASPTFTGVPAAPTATGGTSTTQLATTAFVANAVAAATAGVASFNTRTGAVVLLNTDITGAGGALLAGPSFTGVVTIGGTIGGAGMVAWSAAPGPIGSTTASTGAFTNLTASGTVSGAGFTALLAPYATTGSLPVASSTNPVMDGAVAVGVGTTYARADHVHPSDTSRAPLASPVFTGNPTGPTPATADSSVSLATTAFVKVQGYAPLASPAFTGTPTAPTAANGVNTTQLATTQYVLSCAQNQFQPPTADVPWGNHKITALLDPSNSQDAATKNYVDNAIQGLDTKAPCRLCSTVNIATLSGALTIDGVVSVVGDRVLVMGQTTAAANGIYVVSATAWARSTDTNTWALLISAYTFIEEGTNNSNNGYLCTVDQGGTLGTTPVTWVQFSGAGQITAGNGLTKSGNTISAVGTAARIAVGASIDIDATYAGQSSIITLGSVTTGTWNATTIAVNRGGTGATTLTGYVTGNGVGAFTASATIPNTNITGLGTMSTQNASAVAITGGSIDGITLDCGSF